MDIAAIVAGGWDGRPGESAGGRDLEGAQDAAECAAGGPACSRAPSRSPRASWRTDRRSSAGGRVRRARACSPGERVGSAGRFNCGFARRRIASSATSSRSDPRRLARRSPPGSDSSSCPRDPPDAAAHSSIRPRLAERPVRPSRIDHPVGVEEQCLVAPQLDGGLVNVDGVDGAEQRCPRRPTGVAGCRVPMTSGGGWPARAIVSSGMLAVRRHHPRRRRCRARAGFRATQQRPMQGVEHRVPGAGR